MAGGCGGVPLVSSSCIFLFGNGLAQALQVIQQDKEGSWERRPQKIGTIQKAVVVTCREQGCHRTAGLRGRRFSGPRQVWTKEAGGLQGSENNAHALQSVWAEAPEAPSAPSHLDLYLSGAPWWRVPLLEVRVLKNLKA